MEKWGCSFDELVTRHTNGQLILLMAGMSELESYRQKCLDEAAGPGTRSGRGSAAQRGRSHKMTTEEIKQMTPQEYHVYVNSQLGGGLTQVL